MEHVICIQYITYMHSDLHVQVTPAQLMRPGIGQNASCAVGDCLTSRPKGRLRPRELWFSIYSCSGHCTCSNFYPLHILVLDHILDIHMILMCQTTMYCT